MIDWVRFASIPLLAAIAMAFISAALIAALGTKGRRSPRHLRTITKVFEAPEQPRIYLAIGTDRLAQLYQQTPGAAFTKEREDETETTASGGAGIADIKANIERRTTSKERVIPNEVGPTQKAIAVERHLLAEDRSRSFDLISPDDERPISALLDTLQTEARQIGLEVPPTVTAELKKAWQDKSRSALAPDLRSLGLFVRIRAEFTVEAGEAEGDRKLVARVWNRGVQSASVIVLVRKCDFASPYDDPVELGKLPDTVRATCLGQQQWLEESSTLEMRLISVYFS